MTTTLDKPLFTFTAEDLMSRDLILIPRHMSLRAAAHLLAQAEVSGAPVVDDGGRCVGVLSATDLVRWLDRDGKGIRRPCRTADGFWSDWEMVALETVPENEVGRYMTTDVVTAGPKARITDLSRWMLDAHIHRVVIVDGRGRPVGLVSSTDILAAVAGCESMHNFAGR